MVKRSREDSVSSVSDDSAERESYASSLASIDAAVFSPNKYMHIKNDQKPPEVMRCFLPPHHEPVAFSSYEDFDIHYAQVHANRCSDCRKNFPTEHFLSLHIAENHDPLNEAKRERGEKIYQCFVEGCDKQCSAAGKRRMHLIDKHMFPRNYDFFIVNDGIDKRSSMLRNRPGHRRRNSAAARALQRDNASKLEPLNLTAKVIEAGNVKSGGPFTKTLFEASSPSNFAVQPPQARPLSSSRAEDSKRNEMDELTNTMSSLKFVPPSVRFGRGGRRGGLSRR